MRIRLSTNAIVDAEPSRRGVLRWAWVFCCEDSGMVLFRSEPMFRTQAAALRVGRAVMASRRARYLVDADA